MTARWVRIFGTVGTPGKRSRLGGRKRDVTAPAEPSALTALSRQLIAGVLVSDLLIDQLCASSRPVHRPRHADPGQSGVVPGWRGLMDTA
jgi:hypothetical protein